MKEFEIESLKGLYSKPGVIPITFLDNEIDATMDNNSIYALPYNSTVTMQNAVVNNNEMALLNKEEKQLYSIEQTTAISCAIKSYLVMNIYSLTYDILVAFTNEVFSVVYVGNPIDIVGKVFDGIVGEACILDVNDIVNQAVEGCMSCFEYQPLFSGSTSSSLHVLFTHMMEKLHGFMITYCFNRYINLIIEKTVNNYEFTDIFEAIFANLYGNDEQLIKDAQKNPAVMVEFIGGYMRSIMETYMFRYRSALDLLSFYSAQGLGGEINEAATKNSRRDFDRNTEFTNSDRRRDRSS